MRFASEVASSEVTFVLKLFLLLKKKQNNEHFKMITHDYGIFNFSRTPSGILSCQQNATVKTVIYTRHQEELFSLICINSTVSYYVRQTLNTDYTFRVSWLEIINTSWMATLS